MRRHHPVVHALIEKGAALGTVLAFMMSVIALSLPTDHPAQVLRPTLIGVFVTIVAGGSSSSATCSRVPLRRRTMTTFRSSARCARCNILFERAEQAAAPSHRIRDREGHDVAAILRHGVMSRRRWSSTDRSSRGHVPTARN